MDYKEKLILAKEALDSGSYDKETIEYIFPELKESEDWIPKEIIKYLKEKGDFRSCWLAWLEKQGKHNIGISETTKQELDDNLNKALEKETPESWNKFLDEQKPAWSEEDEAMLRKAIITIDNVRMDTGLSEYYQGISKWLEFLKDRVQPQPKQEWSEEDKNMLQSILDEYKSMPTEKRNWLRTLKDRYIWKPSDEQMAALSDINVAGCLTYAGQGQELINLYEQLKALHRYEQDT